MNTRDLQSAVERRDDALLIDMDRKAELADRAHELAEDLAREIVRDFDRLHGFIARGDLLPHEIVCIGPDGKDSDVEREIMRVISEAAKSDGSHPLSWIATMLIEALAETADVQDEADRRSCFGMADEQADRNDWDRY